MGLIKKNTVHYCCVSKQNQILYAYNGGEQSNNESLASLCLEKSPPFHTWYFETLCKKTFGFLMDDDGFVYFAIVDDVLKKSSVLKFLHHLRDEFKKANSRGRSFTAMIGSSVNNVDDQLVPVVSKLIASLERIAEANNVVEVTNNEAVATTNSTKAPLLGRLSKQEKKKGKDHHDDHVISVEDRERKPERSDASDAAETSSLEPPSRGGCSGSQSFKLKWRRLVQIVLAIDAAICLTLFGIWLGICQGIKCTRS